MDWSRITVVATDLDGTLLRTDKTVSNWTRGRLEAASEAGVTVVVVTARPPRWLAEIEGLHLHGYAIVANGAVVVDLDTGAHLHLVAHRRELLLDVTAAIREHQPDVAFALESMHEFGHEPHYVSDWAAPPDTPVADIGSLVDRLPDPVKLLARHPDLGDHSLAALHDLVGDRCSVSYSGGSGLIELAPHGVDKGAALARLVAELGVRADQVVAVGDMPNDLPMLKWAGHAATVANAHPDLIALADTVLPSNDDDGVGHLIDMVLTRRGGGTAGR